MNHTSYGFCAKILYLSPKRLYHLQNSPFQKQIDLPKLGDAEKLSLEFRNALQLMFP